MNNVVPSLIRTYVPIVVAALVGWLAEAGVIVPEDTSTALTTALGGLAGALYYALVRWAEHKWPVVGVLLGSAKQPQYAGRRAR